MIDRIQFFLDWMGGGAWPFLVGGVICLVNSVNERDLSLLTSSAYPLLALPPAAAHVWDLLGTKCFPTLTGLQGRLTG